MSTAPASQFADLGDVRLHYLSAGDGPPVVLIHGWPQTSHMWCGIVPGLAAKRRVIAPDLRGLGASSRPATGYDKKTLADDCGHWIPEERPAWCVERLLEFFGEDQR